MKAYRCGECGKLRDYDEYCGCLAGIDPRPAHRDKGDAERCRSEFEPLEQKDRWHEKFSWEQGSRKRG